MADDSMGAALCTSGRGTSPLSEIPDLSTHSPMQQRKYLIALILLLACAASAYSLAANSAYKGNPHAYATLEMTGALFGLVAGLAMVVRFYTLGNRFHLLVGLAFLANGAEDLVHGLLCSPTVQQWTGLPAASLVRFIPGTYVSGRLVMGALLIAAASATPWLGQSSNPRGETKRVSLIVLFITVVLTAVAFRVPLPKFIYPYNHLSRPLDFLSATIFLAAFLLLLREYRRNREILTWWILFSTGVNVLGQGMMAMSSSLHDAYSDIAHVYKLLGYLIALLGFSFYQVAIMAERRRAEEVLRIKHCAIASSINPIALANLGGRLTYANEAFLRLWGYTNLSEIIGRRISDFCHSERQASEILESLISRGSWKGESVGRRRDGSTIEIQVSANMVTDEAGRPVCAMASFMDLAEKKKAEEALDHVQKLQGLIPICAHCHRIRNDEDAWQRLEEYFQDHSEAQFSHGVCPDCQKQYYPEISVSE